MVQQCPRCRKNDFKKTCDLTNHLNRKFKFYVREKKGSKRGQTMHLSIENLVNWLANPKIKNNPTIINKKVPKTDIECIQKKAKKRLGKETPTPEIIDQRDESEKDSKDLDKKGIQIAKDMFKVDGAEYAFSIWFVEIESKKYEAGMTEERAQEILNAIDNGEFLIRVKFIRNDSVYRDESQTKITFKIIDKYEPIRESKKAGGKYIRGGPNVILTKKKKPGSWVGIDEKFLVREVSEQSEVERLDTNADGILNCVAERVIEHFDQAKRGHGLTKIRRQKINDWKKKMYILGARVCDVAELEKILKRLITLLDITHGTIFNSGKYRSGDLKQSGLWEWGYESNNIP
ncbi:17408_t:CDS:2, partial [Racocetra persica]